MALSGINAKAARLDWSGCFSCCFGAVVVMAGNYLVKVKGLRTQMGEHAIIEGRE